ncbi:putative Ig domain-containing protein [Aquitalea sp. LB_tupeE]|uniref:putative Ig domain-containing protein n=1 Tax=Aquitalea sp. LB_tupeE TaxID=2748078 RepID=UPI0015BB591A|nr:putative Ig domain-containing protein [Aquitalea sp. LB_tupeE]NWK76588.1 putative Ig domain-containing protein [Aquitalea sp. LB_tupeE]
MSASNTLSRQSNNPLDNASGSQTADTILTGLANNVLHDIALPLQGAMLRSALPFVSAASVSTTSTASTAALATSTTTSTTAVKTGSTAAPSWIATLSDAALKADMNAMSGNVTEAGLAKMVTDLAAELTSSKSTLSSSQFNDLKTIVTNLNVGETASSYSQYTLNALVNGNAANSSWTGGAASSSSLGNLSAGSSAAQLNNLNGKWLLGTDLPTSTATVDGRTFNINYSTSKAGLFGSSGPLASDINQGQLGDCYFLSSIAEVAIQNSGIIRNMITDNGNGSYGVAFHVKGATEYVTVNNVLQTGCNSGPNMWATLLEKAYAQLQAINVTTGNSYTGNSFTAIGNGGLPEYALESITGASQITDYSGSGTSWLCRTYNSSLSGTGSQSGLSNATVLSSLKTHLAAGDDVVLSSYTWSYDAAGKVQLVAGHAMSVYGIDAANGNLEIRNPWGSQTGQYWNTTFEVSLSTLLAAGDTITVDNAGGSVPVTSKAPVITAQTADQTIAANHAFSVSLGNVFTDPQNQALSYKVTLANGQVLPSWMTYNASTNTLSGTTPLTSSSTQVMVKVTDTSGLSASETFTINDTAYAPTLSKATATQLVTPGHTFSIALPAGTFTDPQGETLSYSAKLASGAALPSWLSFNAQTQTFSGTAPTANTSLSLQVTASNQAGLSTSETFTLNDGYAAPTLNQQTATQTINAGKAFSFTLPSTTFIDPQGLALTYKAALDNGQALPSWLNFNAQTETFSGTAPSTAGSFSVKLTATDSAGLSTSETFSINDIATALKAPVLNPLPLMVGFNANGTLNISVPQGTFTDPQGLTLTYAASQSNGQALPSWITFNAQNDTFTATLGHQTESATITVKATDTAGLSASETFSLTLGAAAASHGVVGEAAPTISLVGIHQTSGADLHAA